MVCVWKPVIVLGFPACPTVSTACPTLTFTGRGFRSESTCRGAWRAVRGKQQIDGQRHKKNGGKLSIPKRMHHESREEAKTHTNIATFCEKR